MIHSVPSNDTQKTQDLLICENHFLKIRVFFVANNWGAKLIHVTVGFSFAA